MVICSLDEMEIDKPFLEKSKSDQFILIHNLDLQKTADVIKFLEHKMEILAPYNPDKPYQALFSDNCVEFRLDRRQTTYSLDDENNVKLLLQVSGAGKTRQLGNALPKIWILLVICSRTILALVTWFPVTCILRTAPKRLDTLSKSSTLFELSFATI